MGSRDGERRFLSNLFTFSDGKVLKLPSGDASALLILSLFLHVISVFNSRHLSFHSLSAIDWHDTRIKER